MSINLKVDREWKRLDKFKGGVKKRLDWCGWYFGSLVVGVAFVGLVGLTSANFYLYHIKTFNAGKYDMMIKEMVEPDYNGVGFSFGAGIGGLASVYAVYFSRRKYLK